MSALLAHTPGGARIHTAYPANDTSLRDNAGDYRYLPVDNSN